jgi:hypothetical protein
MLVGGVVVEDGVDGLADRDLALDGVQKADELLMPVALHAAADDLAFQHVEGGPLGLPAERGSLRTLQAVEATGRLYFFAELCTEEPERCSLSYREPDHEKWIPLVEDACSCVTWTAVALGSRPAVVLSEQEEGRAKHLTVLTVTSNGPLREHIELEGGLLAWTRWRALSLENRLILLSEGMPGSLRLAEGDRWPSRPLGQEGGVVPLRAQHDVVHGDPSAADLALPCARLSAHGPHASAQSAGLRFPGGTGGRSRPSGSGR